MRIATVAPSGARLLLNALFEGGEVPVEEAQQKQPAAAGR